MTNVLKRLYGVDAHHGKWLKRLKTKTAHANVKNGPCDKSKTAPIGPQIFDMSLLGRFGWPKRPTQRSKTAPTQTEMTKTSQKKKRPMVIVKICQYFLQILALLVT